MFKPSMKQVTYKVIKTLKEVEQFLPTIPNKAAYDFETANKLTIEEINKRKELLTKVTNKRTIVRLKQEIEADGLSHPSLTTITHMSIAWDSYDATVIIMLDKEVRDTVLEYLVTTENLKVLHRSLFDFRHIMYHTGKIPKNYEDTQLMAKVLLNDVDSFKSLTSIKKLEAKRYGKWAEAKEAEFTIENAFNEDMLLYCATDACATWSLYLDTF